MRVMDTEEDSMRTMARCKGSAMRDRRMERVTGTTYGALSSTDPGVVPAQRPRSPPRQGRWASMAAIMLVAIVFGSAHAAVVEKEGQRYEDAIRVGGKQIVLNGDGVRAAAWFKAYVAGLYLPQKASDPDVVYALAGPKRIAVRMLVDASSTLLAKTFDDGIRKNYKGDALEPLSRRMEALDAQIRSLDAVKKGEEVDLDFEPGSGTHVLVRGKPIGDAIEGEDFYVALLKMFIGERAVDKDLRAALLGAA